MRNTILALGSIASLAVATPAFAVGLCSENPCLGDAPISGAFDTSPPPPRSFYRTIDRSHYQEQPGHTRHTRNYHGGYRYHE
jgi:hypothetical protein